MKEPDPAEIVKEIGHLSKANQKLVLDFARRLKRRPKPGGGPGTPGKDLLRFAGTIKPSDLLKMSQAIKEGCERIDDNEW